LSANLQLYKQEVIDFLNSCTIIFSPLATQINANLQAKGISVDLTRPETFKYYLNLSGQYHSSDTMMTIQSLDTAQKVNFTVEMLANSPRTREAYVVGTPYYATFCNTYPDQTDLIKSIIYPVDLSAAIAAPDFTLLGWGDGILEDTEQDSIIYELKKAIAYIASRWYFPFLSYETYYIWTFWSVFWQSLPNVIFAARIKYLHTSATHSFHIWSYLQSHGIGDYSDILTSQQALFLYRNLRYLEQNKGKQSNLVILVNNLLDSINVGLVGKTIYMNTATKAATCEWTPEFVSTIIPTNNAQSLQLLAPETMKTLNVELINAGLETNNTAEYVAAEETRISRTPLNILPSKLVEIQKINVDQKYGGLLNNFILDTLVWAITSGYYTPTLAITDPTTKTTFSISGKDALALYYYCVHRSCRETPTLLPTAYAPTCAFRPDVSSASIPSMFTYNGQSYPTGSYLGIDMLLGLGYQNGPIYDPGAFANIVADLFLVLIRYVRYSRIEGSKIALEMFLSFCKTKVLQTTPYSFSLSSSPDYAGWASATKLTAMLDQLNAQQDIVDVYTALGTTITSALLPETNPIYAFFSNTNPNTVTLYDRLRALFVELCSYNIAFLDTARDSAWWTFFERVVYTISAITDQRRFSFDPTLPLVTVEQSDTVDLPWITSDQEIVVGAHHSTVIYTKEDTLLGVAKTDTRSVFVPLPVVVKRPSHTDTFYIPRHPLRQTAVFTTDTSAMT